MHQRLRTVVLPTGLALGLTAGLAVGTPAVAAAPPPVERAPVAPAVATPPETLASSVAASDEVVDPSFPVDFVAVTWTGEHGHASVRFRHGTTWTPWQDMAQDGIEEPGHFASGLVPAGDADAYQVRTPAGVRDARSVAINTTDGERRAGASAAATGSRRTTAWGAITRAGWGADEKLRFDKRGKEKAPKRYATPRKFTVHHTAGLNDDPNPAATVRAIYRFHAIDRGWGDIGYQFLIDDRGTLYEGRHTDSSAATAPAFDPKGRAVQATHVADHNSGNIGISLLGTYENRRPSAQAQYKLERLLMRLAKKTRISPTAKSWYDNGAVRFYGENILGHRHMGDTSCPGKITYALLPTLRKRVAQHLAGTLAADKTMASARSITVTPGSRSATITWRTTGDPSDTQLRYWPVGKPTRAVLTPLDIRFVEKHQVSLTKLAAGTYEYELINADVTGNRRVSGVRSFTVA